MINFWWNANFIYEEILKLDTFVILSDLELSKMTSRDFGLQALLSRNIRYKQNKFLIIGLGDMSLDGILHF
jgi:hypothetical protein